MTPLSAEALTATLALVGIVILVSSLLSGLVERSRLPQVAVFLALGAALGPAGLGMLNLTLDSPAVRVVATLSLTLVLFTDAVTLDIAEARRHSKLAFLVLGPGTLLSAALTAFVAWGILGLSPAAAAILGAALASTDPVLLRGFLNSPNIPSVARQALRLESGLNDVVLLPVVLVAMMFLGENASFATIDWPRLFLSLFVLGLGAGVAVGLLSVAALDLVRRQVGVRRDYESLYSLGVAFTAYAAAEAVHGSGFLAAFTAGLTIAALDVELCDCFVDYGGTTAEMALLFTFVLFGGSLIWSGFTVMNGATLLFALIVLLIRPPVFLASLAWSGVERRDRFLIAWFGPRGLSSLLLVLLPVFAGLPGSDRLFAICCLVVLLSVALHGGSPIIMARIVRWQEREKNTISASDPTAESLSLAPTPAASVADTGNGQAFPEASLFPDGTIRDADTRLPGTSRVPVDDKGVVPDSIRISIEELRELWQRNAPIVLLDVRSDQTYGTSTLQARGAVRVSPDRSAAEAAKIGLPHPAWLVAYCA
jgi:NhaP-type Na+/H+ or K+/H+ antiporter